MSDDGVHFDEARIDFHEDLSEESLACFRNVMKSLAERDDYIENVESLLIEKKEAISSSKASKKLKS